MRGRAGTGPADGGDRLAASGGEADDAAIGLVAFDDPPDVALERGENCGRTRRYHHVVREPTSLAAWHGAALEIALPLAGLEVAGRAGAAVLVHRLSYGPCGPLPESICPAHGGRPPGAAQS